MTKVIPAAKKPADVERLIATACIRPDRRYQLWILRSWVQDEERYMLRAVGEGRSWRHTDHYDITLQPELGKKLEKTWKRNKYDGFVGHRTLRSIVRELTGEDIKAKIDAHNAKEALQAADRRESNARYTLAQTLRAALDALNAPDALNLRLQQVTLDAQMRTLLASLTREDRRAAEAVAYGTYGQHRGDD